MNWYNFASLIVGYLLAAAFSSNVSIILTATLWSSAWTYIVLAFWWLIAIFITWLILYILFGAGLIAVLGTLAGTAKVLEWWERRR